MNLKRQEQEVIKLLGDRMTHNVKLAHRYMTLMRCIKMRMNIEKLAKKTGVNPFLEDEASVADSILKLCKEDSSNVYSYMHLLQAVKLSHEILILESDHETSTQD